MWSIAECTEVERMIGSIDEARQAAPLYALMPPRRRVSFLLGGAVSSSMLRGD
jgi:hypothetical protein